MKVNVIGAGLAGVEATYQLIKRGIKVDLYEMRPVKMTLAHQSDLFAELVCSNSLRSNDPKVAVGLLKEEMRHLDSIIVKTADATSVKAGSALAVDRELFATQLTDYLKNHPLVTIINQEVTEILEGYTIIATGPLTSDTLVNQIKKDLKAADLSFFDATAPLIYQDSIDFEIAYYKSRYDKGSADYINCPFTEAEYQVFYEALINAETVVLKDFEKQHFEGCLPIEVMAKRGYQTLLYGPLKPVGLSHNGKTPFAVVQLRQDNVAGDLYNLVGFQTNLTFPMQKEVFRLIPGLKNAQFLRYGTMHRNTYLKAPELLNKHYQVKDRPNLFFAGQITGVEGYVESASSGLLAALNLSLVIKGQSLPDYEATAIITSLANYISNAAGDNFQPMKANFGILKRDQKIPKNKRAEHYYNQALATINNLKDIYD